MTLSKFLSRLRPYVSQPLRPIDSKRQRSQRCAFVRPQLETLEDRVVPSNIVPLSPPPPSISLPLQNDTGLSGYTIWVGGYSLEGGPNTAMVLNSNGQFVPATNIPPAPPAPPAPPPGSPAPPAPPTAYFPMPLYELSPTSSPTTIQSIAMDLSQMMSGRIYFFVEPSGWSPPHLAWDWGWNATTESWAFGVTGPQDPPGPTFPWISGDTNVVPFGIVEYTDDGTGAATGIHINVSEVNEFLVPLTMTLNNNLGQVGQPIGNPAVNLQSIVSGFQTFLSQQTPADQQAYKPLLLLNGAAGQPGGLIAPLTYVTSNPSSALAQYWDPTLNQLFTNTSRTLTLIGDDGVTYTGHAELLPKTTSTYVLDFTGGGNEFYVYSPLDPGEGSNAGADVLGASGAFGQQNIITNGTGKAGIGATSVERQIDQALLRGVVLEDPTNGSSDNTGQWWGDEMHWYPAGSTMDLYAEFLHTWTINGTNIFTLPNSTTPPYKLDPTTDAQGAVMAQAYGFSQDESPDVPSQGTTTQPNVPPKWDPAPLETTTITMTLDPWFPSPSPSPSPSPGPSPSPSPSPSSASSSTTGIPILLFLAEDRFAFAVDSMASMFSNDPLFTQAADRAMSAYNNLLGLYNPALFTGLSGLQSAIYANPYYGTIWDMVGQAAGFDWADHSKDWGLWTESLGPVVALHWAAAQFVPA